MYKVLIALALFVGMLYGIYHGGIWDIQDICLCIISGIFAAGLDDIRYNGKKR